MPAGTCTYANKIRSPTGSVRLDAQRLLKPPQQVAMGYEAHGVRKLASPAPHPVQTFPAHPASTEAKKIKQKKQSMTAHPSAWGSKIGGSRKWVTTNVGQCCPTTVRSRSCSPSQIRDPHLTERLSVRYTCLWPVRGAIAKARRILLHDRWLVERDALVCSSDPT